MTLIIAKKKNSEVIVFENAISVIMQVIACWNYYCSFMFCRSNPLEFLLQKYARCDPLLLFIYEVFPYEKKKKRIFEVIF